MFLAQWGRATGLLFALGALAMLVLWIGGGAPLPQSQLRSEDDAARDGKLIVDVYGRGDAAQAAAVLKIINAHGWSAFDALAGSWVRDRYDFIITSKTFSVQESLAASTTLGKEISGAQIGGGGEYYAYLEGNLRHGRIPFGRLMVSNFEDRYGDSARVLLYSVALEIVVTALLALWLLARLWKVDEVRHLGLGLSAWSLAESYLMMFSVAPTFSAYQPPLALRLVLDVLAMESMLLALYGFARFWSKFPRPISDEELHHFVATLRQQQLQAVGSFRRRWLRLFIRSGVSAPAGEEASGALALGAADIGPVRPARRLAPLLAAGLISGLAWTGSFLLPDYWPLLVFQVSVWCFMLTGAWTLFVTPLRVFKYHRVAGSTEDRRKVEWMWAGMCMAGVAIFAPLVMLMVLYVGSYAVPSLDDWIDLVVVLQVLGFTLGPVIVVMALGLSILYRGTADPRLALRGFTAWTLLSVLLTLLFVFVERTVAVKLAGWWGLPPQTGFVTAGAIVAATFQPLRKRTEVYVNRFVERVLPASLLASGVRQLRAVLVTDISGYTALTARDEQSALIASALMQKEARRLAEQGGGRFVKSTGDGAILCFEDASKAVACARELHRAVAAGAATLNLPPLSLHSGLHWGEVVEMRDGDIYGMTVNVAARIADWAKAGEIVVSREFHDQLEATIIGFQDAGPQSFKNVPSQVVCLRLAAT